MKTITSSLTFERLSEELKLAIRRLTGRKSLYSKIADRIQLLQDIDHMPIGQMLPEQAIKRDSKRRVRAICGICRLHNFAGARIKGFIMALRTLTVINGDETTRLINRLRVKGE